MNRNFGKLIGGTINYAESVLCLSDRLVTRPQESDYLNAGYKKIDLSYPTDQAESGYHYEASGYEIDGDTIKRTFTVEKDAVIARQFSKLKLILALKSRDLYTSFKTWLSVSGYEDEWQSAMVLREDYNGFETIKKSVQEYLKVDDETTEAILQEAVSYD